MVLPPETQGQMEVGEPSIKWEHFPHDADMGVRGIGTTKAQAFEQAALALTAIIVDPHLVQPRQKAHFTCDAADDELLLVDWLNALVFSMDQDKVLYHRFHVAIDKHRLEGTAWGEPVDRQRHEPAVEVKGATYTELFVHQRPNGTWMAQCVVDV